MGNRKTLWLTYAWVDNEDADVDFVVSKLEASGINVRIDRTRIVAGRRLWQQIDHNLLSDDLDGFAIYATENSLRSEACQEELAIILDRVLRQQGSEFPLIGIFPSPMERPLIPSSIATRLHVSLKEADWSARVAAALSGRVDQSVPNVAPYYFKEHRLADRYVYEMRPRDGVWFPASVLVPEHKRSKCQWPFVWAKGQPNYQPAMFSGNEDVEGSDVDGSIWRGFRVDQQVDNTVSLYLPVTDKLDAISFGCAPRLTKLSLT